MVFQWHFSGISVVISVAFQWYLSGISVRSTVAYAGPRERRGHKCGATLCEPGKEGCLVVARFLAAKVQTKDLVKGNNLFLHYEQDAVSEFDST